jgi:hypothetical protein
MPVPLMAASPDRGHSGDAGGDRAELSARHALGVDGDVCAAHERRGRLRLRENRRDARIRVGRVEGERAADALVGDVGGVVRDGHELLEGHAGAVHGCGRGRAEEGDDLLDAEGGIKVRLQGVAVVGVVLIERAVVVIVGVADIADTIRVAVRLIGVRRSRAVVEA